jgi:hypothetical protein
MGVDMGQRARRAVVGTVLAIASSVGLVASTAAPTSAALPINLPQVPPLVGNPTPGTDLFASTIAVGTGGTERICATSPLGFPVTCVEHVLIQPAGTPTAVGTTYGHWIFCREVCEGSLLVHEMVHVAQFEAGGDLFGPLYLLEAAQHGSGCENKYERPAYQTGGQCL